MSALPAGRWSLASGRAQPRDLIFVKLTDSSYRAIEDYLANKGKIGSTTKPTIHFLSGSEGRISIPNTNNNRDTQPSTAFRFSLSSNADLEGPQGSFECLNVGTGKSIRALGAMPTRMRVQANDDVYENTKHRMAIDAENQKSKCTREIKPNQTDIGRKVKVKQTRPPPSHRPVIPTPSQQHTPYTHPPSGQPPAHNYPQNTGVNGYGGSGGGLFNHQSNGGSVHQNGNAPSYNGLPPVRPQTAGKPSSNTDPQKHPIKIRLIQLLALKAYKKPELYTRVNSEGIKDKEKNVIPTILQQISSIKDNSYHLHRHIWNDVDENWPCYTDEEKQILKRRKPQNLTPPLSSDSGHSPSPPPGKRLAPSTQPPGIPSVQPPIKKQRISHYKKPQENSRESGDGSPAALSNGYHSSTSTSGASSGERKNYSDEDTPPPPKSLTPNKRDKGFSINLGSVKNLPDAAPVKQNGYQTSPSTEHISVEKARCSPVLLGKRFSPLPGNGGQQPQVLDKKSPDSTTQPTHSPAPTPAKLLDNSLVPDYELRYTEITGPDQRRKYKSEFVADYNEYRNLHSRIEAVKNKFANLEERLNGETPGGPNYNEIKRQIVDEYQRMQRDGRHNLDLDRYNYLHQKLAHIKRLVGDYDRMQAAAY